MLVAYVDRAGIYRYANQAYCEFWGTDSESLIGRHVQDVVSAEAYPRLKPLHDRVTGGTRLDHEIRVLGANGVDRHFMVRYRPDPGPEGQMLGFHIFAEDMTEVKKAEAARLWSESRFGSLFEQAPMSLQIFSVDGLFKYANPAWEKHFGASREALRGYNLFGDPQLAEKGFIPLIQQAIAGQVVHVPPHEFVPAASGREGRALWQEVYIFPMRTHEAEGSRVLEIAVMALDLTEVMHAIRVRDDFMSIASHELRTPITSIKLQMQSLARRLARDPSVAIASEQLLRIVTQTDRALDRLVRLIGDMLDISRIQEGKLSIQGKPADLGEIAHEVLDRLEAALSAANIPLKLELSPGVTGVWDRDRIEQIVTNLVTNAIRYAPGAPLTVRVSRAGTRGELRVADQGRGIASEHLEQIFDRYVRLESSDNVGGLGLGLFISRQIAVAHGGELRAESEPGQGTVFVLSLPLTRQILPIEIAAEQP
jgi:PAS domain S-box-containing protein